MGDHGITIARGFEEAYNHVSKLPEETSASEVCKEIGYGMLRSMGGASGPIFSTFFIQASIVLKGKKVGCCFICGDSACHNRRYP